MKIIGIIPARYNSTRFPGKPLAEIHGKSMIQRVTEQAMQAEMLSKVVVATDDDRIHQHVLALGYSSVLTSASHVSGTDRCLEALLLQSENYDVVLNIQGDEPYIEPQQIDALCRLMQQETVQIGTMAMPLSDSEILFDPNKVKVVMGNDGRALYFSRQAIPFIKDVNPAEWTAKHTFYKHIGLYAFRSTVLRQICALPVSALEKMESLEQLRWLQNGFHVHLAFTEKETPAIDTPEDLKKLIQAGK